MSAALATVLAALLSAGAAIVVSVINSNAQHKKLLTELDKRDALQAYRLDELEKKMDKHNSVIERTYELETKQQILDEKLKVANHRIDDLEKKGA